MAGWKLDTRGRDSFTVGLPFSDGIWVLGGGKEGSGWCTWIYDFCRPLITR